MDGLARAKNATEFGNFGLQVLIYGYRSNIWFFLRKPKKDSLVYKYIANQGLAGVENRTWNNGKKSFSNKESAK